MYFDCSILLRECFPIKKACERYSVCHYESLILVIRVSPNHQKVCDLTGVKLFSDVQNARISLTN